MRELWVNHKQVDFTNAARQQKVTPGCSLLQDEDQMIEEEGGRMEEEEEEEEEDPCVDNKCRRGSKCVAKRPGEYVCKCQPGWSGKLCEQGKYFHLPKCGTDSQTNSLSLALMTLFLLDVV